MKLKSSAHEVTIGNIEVTSDEFQIKNSAHAFRILSSGLYKNKLRAIVRELSCNALDSHTMAGNPEVPFEMHLPTSIEPYFSIRDFGTSLDHDGILSLYSTYFSSSKTNSNTQIGALGLGSKSPFSYTDNFSITAYKDGKCRVYSAFINEKGVPSIIKMSESESDEKTGICVQMSMTDTRDMYNICQEATNALRHFVVLPVFTGAPLKDHQIRPTYNKEYSNFSKGVQVLTHYNTAVALQGPVEYPLEPTGIPEKYISFLHHNPLVINFEIGELDITASREELSYDKATLKNIVARLDCIFQDIKLFINEQLKSCKTDWEKILKIQQFRSQNFLHEAANLAIKEHNLEKYLQDGQFRNKVVLETLPKGMRFSNLSITSKQVRRDKPDYHYVSVPATATTRSDHIKKEHVFVSFKDNVLFIINDVKKGHLKRIHNYQLSNPGRKDIFLVEYDTIPGTPGYLPNVPDYIEYIKEQFGNPPILLVSQTAELAAKPKIQPRSIVALTRNENYDSERSSSKRFKWGTNEYEFDDTTTYYYVEVTGFDPNVEYNSKEHLVYSMFSNMNDVMIFMREFGFFNEGTNTVPAIFGVRKSGVDEVRKAPNWKNALLEIAKKAATVVPKDIRNILMQGELLENDKLAAIITYAQKHKFEFSENSLFGKVCTDCGITRFSSKDSISGKLSLYRVCSSINSNNSVDTIKSEVYNTMQELNNRYPLLEHSKCNSFYKTDEYSAGILNYIKLIDNTLGK